MGGGGELERRVVGGNSSPLVSPLRRTALGPDILKLKDARWTSKNVLFNPDQNYLAHMLPCLKSKTF